MGNNSGQLAVANRDVTQNQTNTNEGQVLTVFAEALREFARLLPNDQHPQYETVAAELVREGAKEEPDIGEVVPAGAAVEGGGVAGDVRDDGRVAGGGAPGHADQTARRVGSPTYRLTRHDARSSRGEPVRSIQLSLFGPRNPVTVPGETVQVRSSTASTGPYRLVSPFISITPGSLPDVADHGRGASGSFLGMLLPTAP